MLQLGFVLYRNTVKATNVRYEKWPTERAQAESVHIEPIRRTIFRVGLGGHERREVGDEHHHLHQRQACNLSHHRPVLLLEQEREADREEQHVHREGHPVDDADLGGVDVLGELASDDHDDEQVDQKDDLGLEADDHPGLLAREDPPQYHEVSGTKAGGDDEKGEGHGKLPVRDFVPDGMSRLRYDYYT